MEVEDNENLLEVVKITRMKPERKSGGVPLSLNVRKLITVIKDHPIIYQTNHDSYRNANGRNNIWEEIASEMEWSEQICKAKWRACRDQYARELKRFGNNMGRSRWKYAKDLEFLRPYTLKRVYKQRRSYDQMKESDKFDDDDIKDTSSYSSFDRTGGFSGEMQFEKDLINQIREHEYIYNQFHPNYRKFENKKLFWETISSNINKDEQKCRSKWKALRDQFSREAKRISSCEDPDSTPKWKHYEDLRFLEKHVKLKYVSCYYLLFCFIHFLHSDSIFLIIHVTVAICYRHQEKHDSLSREILCSRSDVSNDLSRFGVDLLFKPSNSLTDLE